MEMKRSLMALTMALMLVVLANAQEHTKDSLEQVKKGIADKKAVLIDVREKTEWDKGHLKDAKLLPLSALKGDTLPKNIAELLPKDKVIYAHCAAGGRCLTAADILRKAGYDVRPLKDGYTNLLKEGFPKAK
jgi:rhodanese-related sulfurtransferase